MRSPSDQSFDFCRHFRNSCRCNRIVSLNERALVCISRRVVEIVIRFTSSHNHVRGCITLAQCYSRAAFHPFIPSKNQKIATNIYTVNHDQACNRFENETHRGSTNRQFPAFLDDPASRCPPLSHLLISRVDGCTPLARHSGGWMAPCNPGGFVSLILQGRVSDLVTLLLVLIYPTMLLLLIIVLFSKHPKWWMLIVLHMLLTISFAAIWHQVLNGYDFMTG